MANSTSVGEQNSRALGLLRRFIDKINPSPQARARLLKQIGTALVANTKLRFRDSVDPEGKAWAKLKYRKGKPLLKTGRLRSSITFSATDSYLDVGTNVEYAAMHQYGKGKVPQRAFLGLSQKDEDSILKIVSNVLYKDLKK